jgi:hypothetical protein
MRKLPKGKSLGELNPELAKEWHPTKNSDLTPYEVSISSGKKVWWKCEKGDDHEWESIIANRTKGSGCPVCSGNKVTLSNCLATLNPELAKEWHPTKNADLTPFDLTVSSNKKVWWKCEKGYDHEWIASLSDRNNGKGCPICVNQKIVLSNCLATLNPVLSKEWHPTKNGDLTPYDVSISSGKKVWWKCEKGYDHEWESIIANRTKGIGCPVCSGNKVTLSNCLATLNPELSKEWHPTKNGDLTTYDITSGSEIKVWWKCDKGDDHEWKANVNSRSNGSGCPVCRNRKAVLSNCLATLNPELAKEWHPSMNTKLTPYKVTLGSEIKVWWKCEKGDDHEWEARISDRANGSGCPVCSGNKVILSNCLATLNPELAKEWHATKNGDLSPFDLTVSSNKKVWWKCEKGNDHQWESSINHRTNDRGCPICSGKKVVLSNCLATLNPKLAKEWHPTKNFDLTPNSVTTGSDKKVWWKCEKGDDHEWESIIANRTKGKGCPYCTLTPQSKQELTITFELIKFFKINPKGFKARIKGKIMSIDIYIPKLNLGIEFDGSYWHKGKRALDKLKTEKLEDNGFKIMRIREEPLKIITGIDIISKTPFNAKDVTNDILKHILKTYDLDKRKVNRINEYLLKSEIQNEKGLYIYIEKILTEKAIKKM